jgi:hypothetical protein
MRYVEFAGIRPAMRFRPDQEGFQKTANAHPATLPPEAITAMSKLFFDLQSRPDTARLTYGPIERAFPVESEVPDPDGRVSSCKPAFVI